MGQIEFHPEAFKEYEAAANYYESIQEGLAIEFIFEINYSLDMIAQKNVTWAQIETGVHKYLVRKFPFGIIFRQQGDHLQVIAVAHSKRRPSYWAKRL